MHQVTRCSVEVLPSGHSTSIMRRRGFDRRHNKVIHAELRGMTTRATGASVTLTTGVNLAGDAGDTSPQYFGWGGRQREYPRQYYYVLLDIADQYWLPSVRSASSRFHSAIRRHQFASVRQADSRLTRLVPSNR